MRIAITGSTGLVGRVLVADLEAAGHEVTRVVRDPAAAGTGVVVWDPERGQIDAAGLEGHDAVIHLAGESVAGLWTQEKKARIAGSRIGGTKLLSETLARLERPPRVLLSASATGYYGDRPPLAVVDEQSGPGIGFLARTVVAWEAAALPAAEAGIRVLYLRFGVVMSFSGGVLGAALPIFRAGLGGRLGSGRQIWSWVARSEIPLVVRYLLARDDLSGPINVVTPSPVSNAEFTAVLARVLRRPALLRVPAYLLRLVGGEFAQEMLLSGAHVRPRRLLDSGYRFRYPELEMALRHEREVTAFELARVAERAASP
jgi:uncharacterized protein (TIGR01777 family)